MSNLRTLFQICEENKIMGKTDFPKELGEYIDTLEDNTTKAERDVIVCRYFNNSEVLMYFISTEIQSVKDRFTTEVIDEIYRVLNIPDYGADIIIRRSLDIDMKSELKYSQITWDDDYNWYHYPITMDFLITRLKRVGERMNKGVRIYCPSNEEISFKLGNLPSIKIDIRRHRFEYKNDYINYKNQPKGTDLFKGSYTCIEDDIMNIILLLVEMDNIFISEKFNPDDTIEPKVYF